MRIPASLKHIVLACSEHSDTGKFSQDHVCISGQGIYATTGHIAVAFDSADKPIHDEPTFIHHSVWRDAFASESGINLARQDDGITLTDDSKPGRTIVTACINPSGKKFPPVSDLLTTKKTPDYAISVNPDLLRDLCEIAAAHQGDSDKPTMTLQFFGVDQPIRIDAGYDGHDNRMRMLLMPLNVNPGATRLTEEESEKLRKESKEANDLAKFWESKWHEIKRELDAIKALIAKAAQPTEIPVPPTAVAAQWPNRRC